MRVYAMYDRKQWVIWLFVVIASTDVGVGCVSVFTYPLPIHPPYNSVNYQWGIISNAPINVSPFARAAQGCSEPLGNKQ